MRQKKAKIILSKLKNTYDEIAEDFDKTRQYSVSEFECFKPYLKDNSTVLDLGCGNGRLLKSLKDHKCSYIGVDNNEKLINIAKSGFPSHIFKVGDFLDIPLEQDAADIIFCLRSFHHLPSRKMRLLALSEMRRVLKTNGILIITVWNIWQRKYLKELFKAFFRFIFTFGSYAPNDTFITWNKKAKRYYHAFTPMEINKIISKAGFEIEELFYVKNGNRVPFKQSHDIVIIAKKVNFYDD
jgi:tRNA (uracil-5-)-methyltransferase TRM9